MSIDTNVTTFPAPAEVNGELEATTSNGAAHCPYRRATDLLQRLAPGKMRIGFLLGAGCPLAVRTLAGEVWTPLIPDIAGLTTAVKQELDGSADLKQIAESAWSRVQNRGFEHPTIEDVLSHIRTLKSLCGTATIDGFSIKDLEKLDVGICKTVREIVNKRLPSNDTPYHTVASWIQAIAREKSVEVFTTNYDMLMEQAFEDQGVPYFDGFVGSSTAFLDLDSIAEDDLPPRWARLWKIHGSVNWWLTSEQKIRRSGDLVGGQQLLIYPSHLKYDESRQMPYYAMVDRLRVFLRSGQCVLVTCGYSFADQHINAYIAQGLSGNPNAACIAMLFGDRSEAPLAVQLAKKHANLTLLAADGGVIGTVDRNWTSDSKDSHPAFRIAVGTGKMLDRSKAPDDQCKWLLGDFAAFGKFLANQLAARDVEMGPSHAP